MSVFRTLLMQQDVYDTIYGTNSITFNAKANGLKALTLFGGTEQSGTPTPTTPVDIVCNNGVLTFGVTTTFNTVDGQGTFVSPSSTNTTRIYKAFGKLKAGKYKVKITGDFEFIFQYKDTNDVTPTQYGNIGTWATEGEYELTDENMYYGVAIRNAGGTGTIYPSNFNNIGTIEYTYLVISPVGTVETIQDSLSNTATAEMLLKVGDYQDKQSILDGAITRNVGVLVLDGVTTGKMFSSAWNATYKRCNLTIPDMLISVAATEDAICNLFPYSSSVNTSPTSLGFCTNNGYLLVSFIEMENITSANDANAWLAQQYQAGTPVIVLYPLATPTTETVTGQYLTTKAGTNTITITQASISSLDLEAKYKKGSASGGTYYAYTDSNNNTIYSKDSLASASFTLQNVTNTNCTDLGNGVYRGGSGKYLTMTSTPAIASANSWEFKTKVRYVPTSGYSCIFGCSGSDAQTPIFGHVIDNKLYALLSSNGTGWDLFSTEIVDIDTSATLTLVNDTTYYFKFGFTGSEYYLWYSTVGWNDTGTTLTYLRTTTKVFCADPLMLLNNNFSTSSYYWGGDIDLSETSLTIDNTTTTFGSFIGNQLYNSSFQALTTDYKNGTGIIATDMENGALIVPTTPFTTSMEMQVHFKTNANWPNLQLTGGADDVTHNSIYFQNYDSILVSWASSNGTTPDILSNFYVAYNMYNLTEYWLKTIWDGAKYDFYLSTDGTNFTNTSSQTSSSPVFWNNNPLYLGNKADKSITQCYKQYYLDGTYIKCDGVTVFDGATTLKSALNSDGCTLSGERKSDIIINSTVYYRNPSKDISNKYYAYKDSSNNIIYTKGELANQGTFTLQNATEQGTLTKYGEIYSNFSGNNYVLLDNTYTFRTSSWKISLEFITGTLDTGGRETLFNAGTPAGVEIAITNDNCFTLATNTNGDTVNVDHKGTYIVQPYTHYWLEASYDGVAYRLKYSLDGINYVEDVTFESTSKIYNQNSSCYLGKNGRSSTSIFFNGYMIMSGFKITISDNDYTFGSLTTQPSTLYNSSLQELSPQPYFGVIDVGLSNCSIVGSLAENNGVLSNFSISDFLDLTLPKIILGSSWSFKIKVHTSSDVTTYQNILHFYRSSSSNTQYGVSLKLNSGKFGFAVCSRGASFLFNKAGTYTVQPDTDYWLECSYDGTTYKFKYSLDGENYTQDITYNSSSVAYSPLLGQLGIYKSNSTTQSAPWTGTIDLKETSLTIGSKFISFYFTNTSVLLLSDYSYYERNSGADR